ncbi:MAG: helix-turn-helix domain-containing protein [Candidatus Fimenecus sp.]
MTLGDKLSKLRKENQYTQEQLADILGVSRQSVSKWESDIAYPETEKLIQLSELFHCSLDYLLKDTTEQNETPQPVRGDTFKRRKFRERKSERTLWGLPLWHIGKRAHGVVAIGLHARGIVAIGLQAQGVVSVGVLCVGLLSFGFLSLGGLAYGLCAFGALAVGCFAVGIFAVGAVCFGILSVGAVALGELSVGAFAIGRYAAVGDYARAMIAIGDTQATGDVFQKIGALTAQEVQTVKALLDTTVPTYFSWASEIVKLLL